jgi:uncharacterized protein (TIGR02001 family)
MEFRRSGGEVPAAGVGQSRHRKGLTMKKLVISTAVAIALGMGAASAADLKPVYKAPPAPVVASPWDFAFGSAIMNDYIFRGITQSGHRGSVAAYFEPRYNINPNLQLYVGLSGESIDFPNHAAAEIDFYGGVRPTFGPLALDLGFWYYYYPGGLCFGCVGTPVLPNLNVVKNDVSFWEVYAKGTYTFNDQFNVGANFYYTNSFLNSGADGEYVSGTAKYSFPGTFWFGVAASISGEFGHQFLGTTDSFYGVAAFPQGIKYASYNTWNVGLSLAYKVFTLDLRYYDTDLSKGNCNAFTGDHTTFTTGAITPINPTGVSSNWCSAAFVAKLSADLTWGSLK